MGHKRVLTPLVANPLLGSALTAPKRKRGRPRKLSGSSNGPTPVDGSMAEDENPDHEMRLHHPNRPDSPCKFDTNDEKYKPLFIQISWNRTPSQ